MSLNKNQTSSGISKEDWVRLLKVFSNYPQIEEVILYGSRAKGNFQRGSDLDLVLKGNTLSSSTLALIVDELDELLLPYKMDVSLFDHIHQSDLLDHIQRVGKRVYRKTSQ